MLRSGATTRSTPLPPGFRFVPTKTRHKVCLHRKLQTCRSLICLHVRLFFDLQYMLTSAGSQYARDNVAQFIDWARALGVPQAVMFETNDLVNVRMMICDAILQHRTSTKSKSCIGKTPISGCFYLHYII